MSDTSCKVSVSTGSVNHSDVIDLQRSSGIQLHLTSLPGGRLGPEAYRFADWLAAAGQSWWQLLPLNPPDRHRSPYKARSAFAAWPGLLESPRAPVAKERELDFRERNAYWIGDWERLGGRGAVADQVRFDREWGALRRYCEERGIRLLGDVAIYVAPDSVDHRAHPELFQDGVVAGAPPDAFSKTGQLWGNPLYDWPALQRRGYRWWVERMRRTLSLFDVARIDHFRGFVAYWAVPRRRLDARSPARWKRGPGRAGVRARSSRELGLPVRGRGPRPDHAAGRAPARRARPARDAGPAVRVRARRAAQRASAGATTSSTDSSTPAPTTTTPRVGSSSRSIRARRAVLDAELAARGIFERREPWWGLIRLAMSSPARVAMLQAQDVLGLGSEARMNDPTRSSAATGAGSWSGGAHARGSPGVCARRPRRREALSTTRIAAAARADLRVAVDVGRIAAQALPARRVVADQAGRRDVRRRPSASSTPQRPLGDRDLAERGRVDVVDHHVVARAERR